MRLSTVVAFAALLTGCAHSQSTVTMNDEQQVAKREQELLRRMTNVRPQHTADLVAPGFRCEVIRDGNALPLNDTAQRYSLCTGIGHDLPDAGALAKSFDKVAPRTGIIEDMQVQLNGDSATVVSHQAYRGWVPYDGPYVRRSVVTDKWVRHEGEWKLSERVSVVAPPES